MTTRLKLSDAITSPDLLDMMTPEERQELAQIEGRIEPVRALPPQKILPPTPAQKPKELEIWKPVITCMEDVLEEDVLWLWPGYIALRKACLIEGDPSHGKTWLTLAIAAAVSRGWPLPDPITGRCVQVTDREPRNVIYMTAEDGLGDTIKPRLVNLGADCSRIFIIEGQRQGDAEMEPVGMADLDILRQAMKEIKPALVILDPLQAFLGSGVDMHRANEVRPLMAGMMRLAEESSCAVAIVRHLNKGSGGKVAYRGMGSIDFAASARTVLLVGRDPDDPARRVIIPTKCNLGVEGVPTTFILTPETGFEWAGKSDITAEELLNPEPKDDGGDQSREQNRLYEAVDFLENILANGKQLTKDVKKEQKALDISDATLRRARENIGVEAVKVGSDWYWMLPNGQDGPRVKTMSNMGNMPQTPNRPALDHVVQGCSNERDEQHGSNADIADDSGMLFNLLKENTLGDKQVEPVDPVTLR